MHKTRNALIAGASGLVGGHLLQLLLKSDRYSQVISVGRRELPIIHPKLDQKIIDFDQLVKHQADLTSDDVFCCLGTTIKKAGSNQAFYKVDYTYAVQLANLTASRGALQFLVISAMGADKESIIFYNKVKGEMEDQVSRQDFKAVHIFRPSLLLGDREEKRTGEEVSAKIMKPLSKFMVGPMRKYRPIEAEMVAEAMLIAASQERVGVTIYNSDKIELLGNQQ